MGTMPWIIWIVREASALTPHADQPKSDVDVQTQLRTHQAHGNVSRTLILMPPREVSAILAALILTNYGNYLYADLTTWWYLEDWELRSAYPLSPHLKTSLFPWWLFHAVGGCDQTYGVVDLSLPMIVIILPTHNWCRRLSQGYHMPANELWVRLCYSVFVHSFDFAGRWYNLL